MSNAALDVSFSDTWEDLHDSTAFLPKKEKKHEYFEPRIKPLGKLEKTTQIESKDNDEKNSQSSFSEYKPVVEETLENEFYCIVDSVNYEIKEITARVYDMAEHIQLLEISAAFSEFLDSEQDKIHKNAVFYWRIGSRTITEIKGKKEFKQVKSFSNFRMRLLYVSKRALESRVQAKVEKYSKLFR